MADNILMHRKNKMEKDESSEKKVKNMGDGIKMLEKTLKKYDKGEAVEVKKLRPGLKAKKIQRKELIFKDAKVSTAKAEILLTEQSGLLEAAELESTCQITQKQILKQVDLLTKAKMFDLSLDQFGPYQFRYTKNGRHLVLGGRKGHLASFDWITKKLHFEVNVMESIHDVTFMHTERMVGVAQKKYTYIYDHQGVELHCLKQMDHVLKLEFLPYHFLLCAGSEKGFLSWIDITLGEEVTQIFTKKGKIGVMCQNPSNAILCCGHANGTVSMWTPNCNKPVFEMLCHPHALRGVAFNSTGQYFATTGVDRLIRLWDARNMGRNLSSFHIKNAAHNISFSQTGLLASSQGNIVEVYKNATSQEGCEVYMRHRVKENITDLRFCPYEDFLGVSNYRGFSSLVIPGSATANYDAYEDNPYISASGRREAEIKSILEKIPSGLITMDVNAVAEVDIPRLEERLEAKRQLKYLKVPKIDMQPRHRMKGKSGSAKKFKRKIIMKNEEKKQLLRYVKERRKMDQEKRKEQQAIDNAPVKILDRFKPKKVKKI